ncbi:MAG: hypothetical protein ACI8P3_001288 [Saprospiraceae bacterium]|jgi:hypothetical protein
MKRVKKMKGIMPLGRGCAKTYKLTGLTGLPLYVRFR